MDLSTTRARNPLYDKIILGIDPGTNIMGYGVLGIKGNQLHLIELGVIKLAQYNDAFTKLGKIFEKVSFLIDTHLPDELIAEAPFYAKNAQAMLKLGRAQGVALAAALHKGLVVHEYLPRVVKQSVTGKGNATKEQVAGMLQTLLHFKELPEYLDATDALAVAVCHYLQGQKPVALVSTTKPSSKTSKGKKNAWQAFVQNNPDKLL